MGFALYEAQCGLKPTAAKPLKGFGGAGVLEVVSDYQSDTYRAVYTVRLEERVYVLHAFQKKSKKGIATPKADIELIKRRLRQAEELHKEWQQEREGEI
jgi:phage-related protein